MRKIAPCCKAQPFAVEAGISQEAKTAKILPRLLAPRPTIAETVAANRAASLSAARSAVKDTASESEEEEDGHGGGGVEASLSKDTAVRCSQSSHRHFCSVL